MKSLVIIVIHFFCVSLLFGEEYGYFKNIDTFEIDFLTGDSYNEILSNYILHNKIKIKCVEQTHTVIHDSVLDGLRESWVRTNRAKYFYNLNGNLIKIEDDSSTDNYLYTENGYYIGYEPLKKKYVYVADNQRIRYNEDNTIFSRETITDNDNEFTVQEETTGYGAKSLWLTHKYNYKYEDKRILKFESTAFSMSGKERNLAVYDFEYDAKQRLNKVTLKRIDVPEKKEIGLEVTCFEYDQDGNIKKITNSDLKRAEITVYEFYYYDKYGNWQLEKRFYNDKFCEEIKRKIEYGE